MKRIAMIAVLGCALMAARANAQPSRPDDDGISLRWLAESCRVFTRDGTPSTVIEVEHLGECFAYLRAVEVVRIMYGVGPQVCMPGGVRMDQMAKVLVKYADDHPEKLHESAVLHLMRAWSEAFPCK